MEKLVKDAIKSYVYEVLNYRTEGILVGCRLYKEEVHMDLLKLADKIVFSNDEPIVSIYFNRSVSIVAQLFENILYECSQVVSVSYSALEAENIWRCDCNIKFDVEEILEWYFLNKAANKLI